MLRLYDYLPSGNGYKVRLLLAQLAVPFELVTLDIVKGETRTPEFLAKNPNGRIPLLEIEAGKFLAESNAILFYLSEGTRYLPDDRWGRAQVLQWMCFEQYSHEPNIATVRFWVHYTELTPERRAAIEQKRPLGYAALDVMERHLATRKFFVAERYTIADIALYAYTHVAGEGGFDLERYPAVRSWLVRVRRANRPRADHLRMTSTIAVLGATGVYGRHLVPRLSARGHRVRALVRRPEAAALAAACGADVRVADIFDGASLRAGLAGCDVGVNLATALPRPGGMTGDFALNDRVRREGAPVWVRACQDAGVPRIIQQSIAMVNAGIGDAWTDEDTVATVRQDDVAGLAIGAALAMEETVRQSDLDWIILRGGLFYGPGTGFDDDWFARARAGKLRLPGDGSDYVSLVHVADMADATVAAIERWPSRRPLIVADDRPSQWRDIFAYVAAAVGGAAPEPGGRAGFPSFRVSNRRARTALSWAPFYSDYRAGLLR